MSSYGWVKLHRDLLDHDMWTDEPFTRGQAWVDLFALANHADKEAWIDGRVHTVKRGQLITSMLKLAARWQWSRKKVKAFLEELAKAQMIALEVDTKKTIVTICEYERYQARETTEGTAEGAAGAQKKNNGGTTEEQQKHTNKNDQELKELEEDNTLPAADRVESAAPTNETKTAKPKKLSKQDQIHEWRNLSAPPDWLNDREKLEKFPDSQSLVWLPRGKADAFAAKYGEDWVTYWLLEFESYIERKPRAYRDYREHDSVFQKWHQMKLEKGLVFAVHPQFGRGYFPSWQIEKLQAGGAR